MAQSTKAPAQSLADPTSVVVVDEESKEASLADFSNGADVYAAVPLPLLSPSPFGL